MSSNLIIEKLIEKRREIGEVLLLDQPKDYASYRFLVGKAQGLEYAIMLIEQIIRKGMND